ncbi:hypothetical protein [Vibrio sp. 1982]|uniref:hypothetical protein n=1 Tax=Vibrio sp. 1982 TaxID=3074586 RepID=UPI00296538A7|nr:hypothetical protein [Vibrio sp. 1982]MDW2216227.1 hypothetical protein [Vibrio sp. 1982]
MKITEVIKKDITIECSYTQVDAIDAYMIARYGNDLIKERVFQPPGCSYYLLVYKVYTSTEMTNLCAQDPSKPTDRYMGNQTRSKFAPVTATSVKTQEMETQEKESWLKRLMRSH